MSRVLWRTLEKLFPVRHHEWPKVLLLLSVAILIGVGASVSRAASEGMFLSHLGVAYLPSLLLANPLLVLVASMVYGAYSDRISNDRMLIYTSLLPVPLIILMRLLIVLDMSWVYFLLYTFVLAYAAVLATSWSVYLADLYDVQEAKRLFPFISSGVLIGTVIGGVGVVFFVRQLGAPNVLLLWVAALVAGVILVRGITRLYTPIEIRKPKRGSKKPGLWHSIAEGIAYSRTSALFMTTAIASIATMAALQLIDFEYSKIIRAAFPDSAALTAFLGIFDGLTTLVALVLQWFVVPWCLRRFGVQGTNLLFPYVLLVAFGGIALVPFLPTTTLLAAMFARFTRSSLMPTLRGTTRALMLHAVPRKTGALVRSFNTAMVLPLGQSAGALLLLLLKDLAIPWLFPVLGIVITAIFLLYSYKQNIAYGGALLDLLREDRVHLLDLEADDLRQLDANAVEAVSTRLRSDNEEVSLAAVELLRSIGSPPAYAALRQHLPYAAPTVTAAALHALAASGSQDIVGLLRPYLDDAHAQVRMAALAGLRRLGDAALQPRAVALLDDADVQVQAAALALVLTTPEGPAYAQAQQRWEAMLDAPDTATQIAALAVFTSVPETPLQGRIYRALDHPDHEVRCAALRVLLYLAETRRITGLDSALLRALEADHAEVRHLALQVLTALGTDEALEHMLVLLDDEQPQVRETLIRSLRSFGKRAVAQLFQCLRSPQASLIAKESALVALAHMHGAQADQLLAFWEDALHDVYQYRLMLACLEDGTPVDADAFLRVALQNAHDQILSLLVQLLAVWTSPDVARLVEGGLHDTDRHKRASALEALESLSARRFTRLFLPILAADGAGQGDWRDVAYRQWQLACPDVRTMLETCLHSTNKWIVIGALLSSQARATAMGQTLVERLQHYVADAGDAEIRDTAERVLGIATVHPRRFLSLTEVMLFLKRVPLYRGMNLEQLHTIAVHMTEQAFRAGEVIFCEGDLSHELYIVVSGKVDIVQQRTDTPHTLAVMSTGDFFGDMAIFEDRPRSAGAVAVEPTVLLTLSPEHFRQIILQDPSISFEIFRALSARIRRFDEEAQEVAG